MTKHTEGPWRTNGALVVGPRMALKVALVYRPELGNAPDDKAEFEANARLLASAPDMAKAAAALIAAWDGFDDDGPAPLDDLIEALRAALARATAP